MAVRPAAGRARGLKGAELHLGLPRHDRKSLLYSKSQPQPGERAAGRGLLKRPSPSPSEGELL